MGMGSPAERTQFFPGAHQIGAAVSGPRIAVKFFYGHEDFQGKRDDNKNKICAFQGGWAGRQGGKLSKTLFFIGNVMTIKFWKWTFYRREILLSWRRLLDFRGSFWHYHRVLQGAPPRGRQLYFPFPSAPDYNSKRQKSCNPVGGTPSSAAWHYIK